MKLACALLAIVSATTAVQATGLAGRDCQFAPVDCELYNALTDPSPWGPCKPKANSDKWVRTKVLGIKTESQGAGKPCPAETDPIRIVEDTCAPNDCVPFTPAEDTTTPFSSCTADGSGKFFKFRVRGVKVPATNGGKCDETDRTDKVACDAVPCVVLEADEDTGPYGPCLLVPGSIPERYAKSKVLGIKTPAQNGGACPTEAQRTYSQVCSPINCVPVAPEEDTGPFGPCTFVDGKYVKSKLLGIKTPAQFGGACGDDILTYTVPCTAIDCVVKTPEEDTGPFGNCTDDDGDNKFFKSKVLGIKTEPQFGGKACPARTDPTRIVSEFCPPVKCVPLTPEEDTGDYGACSLVQGKFVKSKVLGIKTPAQNGGTCDEKDRTFTQPCAAIDCVVNTPEEDKAPLGNCTDNGSGKWFKSKVLGIKTPAQYGGTDCVPEANRTVSEFCPPVNCTALDSSTGTFGNCTDNGNGKWFKSKVLGIKDPAVNGGSCDDKDRTVTELCEAVACVVNKPEEDTSAFGACKRDFDGDDPRRFIKTKTLGIKTPALYGGSCPAAYERQYSEVCPPVKCVPLTPEEDTGDYGPCVLVAGKYVKSKVLGIKTPAQNGGTCDEKDRTFTQPCAAIDCVVNTPEEDKAPLGNCTDNGSGKWFKSKVLGIKTPAQYGGTDCVPETNRTVSEFCPPVNCTALDSSTGTFGNCTDNGSGKWYKAKVLGIKDPASNGGSCLDKDRTVTELCPAVNCTVKTPSEDKGDFGPCLLDPSTYTPTYLKTKILGIRTPAQFGGFCPLEKDRTYSEVCPPVDCVPLTPAEDKGNFGACTLDAATGKYLKSKTLGVKTPAQYGGKCLDKDRKYSEVCPPVSCVVKTPDEDTGSFGSCTKFPDGLYYRTKVLGIKTPAQYGGACPSEAARTVKKPCPDDGYCVPSDPLYDLCLPGLAQCGKKETGWVWTNNLISVTKGLALWQCCDKCSTTPGCVAYSHIKESKECRLTWATQKWDYVYGTAVSSEPLKPKRKTCSYEDDSILWTPFTSTIAEYKTDDLDECCTKCRANSKCKAFEVSGGTCHLESSEGFTTYWSGRRVGYVN